MKPLLLFTFLCLHSFLYSQITFEEISVPKDFNISAVRKSPIGEYFIQAVNDKGSIYTSMNGHDWTWTPFQNNHTLDEIVFFSDGTPLLQGEGIEHLIRRNGNWYTMDAGGGWNDVEASFIKDDTLFVYQAETFAYSLDKGKTFTTVFTFNEGIIDHTAHLWKFDHHFVLHHTAGAVDSLSIFTEDGQRVFNQELNLGITDFTYNTCGQILFYDHAVYYLLQEQGLSFTQGSIANIHPQFSSNSNLLSQGGNYYLREGNTIYKTTGCNFIWETVATNDQIQSKENIWIDQQGDIFLYDRRSDHYIEQISGSNFWQEYTVDINFALIEDICESAQGHQIALTSNLLFIKQVKEVDWQALDTIASYQYEVQYSPDGDLYVKRYYDILYSKDNGLTFSTIQVPDSTFLIEDFSMKVLDDDILFITAGFLGISYYTLNNGKDWIPVSLSLTSGIPLVKLVDNYILIADYDYDFVVTKINLGNNELISESLGDFSSLFITGAVIQDDGTIYFQVLDLFNSPNEGLYRYRFGEGIENLGLFQDFGDVYSLYSSDNELYEFGSNEYYVFDGEEMTTYSYTGLPEDGNMDFILSENQYLYVIIDNHSLFRSSKPLSYPQYIKGSIYHDADQNCFVDTLDATLNYWQVKVESDDHLRITNTDRHGNYKLSVPQGEYTVSSQPLNGNWDLCEYAYPITVDDNTTIVNQDFLALGIAGCAELEIDFSTPLLRRCFDNYYSIRVRNTGPESSTHTTLTLELDAFFDFISATVPYTLIGDSIVKFDFGVLAVNDEISFKVFFTLSCDAALGMEHCLRGILNDDNECGDTRSSYTECQKNIGSIDPNDKRIFNEAGKEVETVDKGEYIYYHIRFQNTGTDTAFKVRIVDALSPKLDLSTLEMLSASHPYDFIITDGPALAVTFENILLPDSTTNEPASHGFIKFRIKPLPEFDYGTSIPNQAGIYFDFNDPVLTNEATLVIQQPVGIKEAKDYIAFNIFPNPTSNVLTLAISDSDLYRIDAYAIIDQLGRTITQSGLKDTHVLNVAHLASGIYNLVLKENGITIGMKKFVRL